MTPEEAFRSGGQNPQTGLWVGEWYASGSVFTPVRVMHEGKAIVGLRQVTALDMASGFFMDFDAHPEPPNALRAERLIPFMDRVCDRFGPPMKGWVISHSCWLSSLELSLDEDTAQQGEFLESIGVQFGPMQNRDKDELRLWGTQRHFKVLFDADQVFENG